MRTLLPIVALCAACSPPPERTDEEPVHTPGLVTGEGPFATQTDAPTPDYATLVKADRLEGEPYVRRERGILSSANAREVGQLWFDRLEARNALLGAGYDGKGIDGAIQSLDVGMTESEFEAWAAENGWSVPSHIAWTFVASTNLPPVSEAAKTGIRVWPASSARTGAQNEALLSGRVELRDGCFWASEGNGPADRLAFFHAEIGLDKDEEGFFILRDRVGGQVRARLGEPMVWGGPPSAYVGPEAESILRKACGNAPILVVGSPESEERMFTNAPHLRSPTIPPLPPGNR